MPWSGPPDTFLKDGKLDIDAVVKHFEDIYRSDSSIVIVEVTVTRPRGARNMTMKIWTRGGDKALIVIQQPARDAGTATLKVDTNLWIYLPRIKRTIRIPPSMMLASCMGTDRINDDLVRETSFSEDYGYRLVSPSVDPPGWLVRFDARPGFVGLQNHVELVFSEDGTIPLQGRYFDRKDRLARTIHWDDVREFDGRRLPLHMTLVPEDDKGYRTEMRYQAIRFNADVTEDTFSLSNLERHR